MADHNTQQLKKPARMSAVPIENRKPSVLIEILLWAAFIIPVIFLWMAFQSWIMVGIIIALRILIMGFSHYESFRKKNTPRKPGASHHTQTQINESQEKQGSPATYQIFIHALIEEAKFEILWVLEKFKMYNKKEETNLKTYRTLRGWE